MPRSLILVALALFGFAPTGDPVQVGEDAPHLAVTPALQLRLQDRAAVRDFRERWGEWYVRFDERDGTPRLLLGPGVALAQADALARDLAILAGIQPGDLVLERRLDQGTRTALRYRQYHRGAPVEWGVLDLYADNGRISVAQAGLHPGITATPAPGEVILPRTGARGALTFTAATRTEQGDAIVYLDRTGAVLHRYDQRHWLDLLVEERTAGGPLVRVPARQVATTDGIDAFLTDDLGFQPLPGPFDVTLEGPFLAVYQSPEPDPLFIGGVDDDTIDTFADASPSATNVQTSFHTVRDWLIANSPANPWIPDLVPATVDMAENSCNAFYTNGTINFHDKEGDCVALGRIADVVYHEYGHGIHHYGLLGGVFAGDVSEGTGDFVSATINDDPYTGVGKSGPGTWIRECETDKVWPVDANGEVHNDGLIWASFLWDLREAWGAAAVDPLFLEALTYGPTLTEAWVAMLAADDDDGDATNGTPNDCEILDLMNEHGIGPGPLGIVNYAHEPIPDQPTGAGPAGVSFTLSAADPACSDLDPDSATVWWTLDAPGATIGELAFQTVAPTRLGNAFTAEIPAQVAGSRVAWFVSWANSDGTVEVSTHGGDPEALYRYWVGDQAEVTCEGFEAGIGQYAVAGGTLDGEVNGVSEMAVLSTADTLGPWSPDGPATGLAWLGTRTDPDGEYKADNAQFATGPTLAIPLGGSRSLLHLRYQRWLSVEGSEYDVAAVVLNGTELWRNPFDASLADGAWTTVSHDLRGQPDLTDELRFAWTLTTDGGLEYGGWNLDDVCLVALADPERHYRASGFAATDDGDTIALSWTQPAVRPLFATAVVRHSDHVPTSPDDGVIVDLDLAPVPAAARDAIDPDATPGLAYHYAVFAADAADNWYLSTVDGENADAGIIPVPDDADPEPEPDPEDPATPGGEKAVAEGGCGCHTEAPTVAPWLWIAGAAALARRGRGCRRSS
jgi:hypothetical protein